MDKMSTWILIIMLYSGNVAATTTQEFKGQQACVEAASKIIEEGRSIRLHHYKLRAFCVPKAK